MHLANPTTYAMPAFRMLYPTTARLIATIHTRCYVVGRAVQTGTHGIDTAIADSMSAGVPIANPTTSGMPAFGTCYPTMTRSIATTHTRRYSAGRAVHTSTHGIYNAMSIP